MESFFKKHWKSICVSLLILYLCMMDTKDLPEVGVSNLDKLVHFVMSLFLSVLVYIENSAVLKQKISFCFIFFGSFLFPVLYSGLIEIIQEYFSPTRSGDWMDFLFDGIGALTGIVICSILNKRIICQK